MWHAWVPSCHCNGRLCTEDTWAAVLCQWAFLQQLQNPNWWDFGIQFVKEHKSWRWKYVSQFPAQIFLKCVLYHFSVHIHNFHLLQMCFKGYNQQYRYYIAWKHKLYYSCTSLNIQSVGKVSRTKIIDLYELHSLCHVPRLYDESHFFKKFMMLCFDLCVK
jgi:hypothetical protein